MYHRLYAAVDGLVYFFSVYGVQTFNSLDSMLLDHPVLRTSELGLRLLESCKNAQSTILAKVRAYLMKWTQMYGGLWGTAYLVDSSCFVAGAVIIFQPLANMFLPTLTRSIAVCF